MFHGEVESGESLVQSRTSADSGSQLSTNDSQHLEFLGNGFEQVALDDVGHLVFAEIAQLDAAFETDAHFLHVILETPERGQTSVVNRLAASQNSRPRRPGNPPVGNETAGDNS